MLVQEIRAIAKNHGIKTTRMKKSDMIRSIQIAEGNFDCFSTAENGYCDQNTCLWRNDCLKLSEQSSH
ncbi:MAG: Rho termination factor N-terminal domain-containing protein [Gammaproteobacteria bacterium]|nr:Rho termination factor N-terminal domain-containing protein [Gammaproteobacteria bacterium]MDH5734551.1 Rho termination factor N-terminal domain-containing protein [Gammaproteobacteria bacterium]